MFRGKFDLDKWYQASGGKDAGAVQIHACKGGTYDLTSAHGRLTAGMLALIAHSEVEIIQERRKGQTAQRRERGEYYGGRYPPFGYRVAMDSDGHRVRGQLAVDKTEAAAVRQGAKMVLSGSTMFEVAQAWNARGLTTPAGKAFETQSVRSVLTCSTVAGKMDPVHSDPVERDGKWDAILSWEQVQAICQLLEDNEDARVGAGDRRPRQGRGAPPRFLLSGLLVCGVCGSPKVYGGASGSPRREVYKCMGGWHGQELPPGVGRNHFSRTAAGLDAYVAEAIRVKIEEAADEMMTDTGEDLEQLRATITEMELTLKGFEADYYAKDIKATDLARARAIWEPRLAEARAARNRALGYAENPLRAFEGQDAEGIAKTWDDATTAERRIYARALIERIVVRPVGRGRPKGSGIGMKRGQGSYFAVPMGSIDIQWRIQPGE